MIQAACHVHSTWSYDGKWSLKQIAAEFSGRGYRAVLMTEHDRGFTEARRLEHRAACAEASSDRILVIPGIEYSDADNVVHILVWGDVPFLGEGVPTGELLPRVHGAGGIAVMAHPTRKEAWKRFNPTWTAHLSGIEIWNRKTDGWAPSTSAGPLLRESRLPGFVGMDFHDARQLFPLATLIDVPNAVSESVILQALHSNRVSSAVFGWSIDVALKKPIRSCFKAAEGGRRILAKSYRRLAKKRPSADLKVVTHG